MTNLTLRPKPLRASITEVHAEAVEQKTASEVYLELLRSEPVLSFAVNMTNSSRLELVPDDRGSLSLGTTSSSTSQARRKGMSDKFKRQLVVQELSNTCHLELLEGRANYNACE